MILYYRGSILNYDDYRFDKKILWRKVFEVRAKMIKAFIKILIEIRSKVNRGIFLV
jgi:hypothetical protein